MAEVYLESRRAYLRKVQNPDGGWGYFPGKSSWLEPTAYAMIALNGDEQSAEAVEQAWKLVCSWQLTDGSWRAGAQVEDATWATALALTVSCIRDEYGPELWAGVGYLLSVSGAETRPAVRLLHLLGLADVEVDPAHSGWPWRKGNSSWIEPTAHTLVALKKISRKSRHRLVAERIAEAEQMILSRRCRDGGWNYGNRTALHMDLPSYPETTALGLLALEGGEAPVKDSLELARALWQAARWPLGNAWLTIALRLWGEPLPEPEETPGAPRDVILAGLQAIGHPNGNFHLLHSGGAS